MTDTERIEQLERLVDELAEIAIGAINKSAVTSGRWYHYMKREGGSRCIYYTKTGADVHFVTFDTLDKPMK